MGWMVLGLSPGKGKRFFLLHDVQTGSGVHPAANSMGIKGSFRWCKVVRACEADHSCLASADFKNECKWKSARLLCLHSIDKDNIAFLFTFTY
jgi:hypothetical protein